METIGFIIELEDNGQDFLKFTTEKNGQIVKTEPFQGEIWNGGFIPVEVQLVGEPCMMHKPPHYQYGFLKHNVTKITKIERDDRI
jgi:hypothetical protein